MTSQIMFHEIELHLQEENHKFKVYTGTTVGQPIIIFFFSITMCEQLNSKRYSSLRTNDVEVQSINYLKHMTHYLSCNMHVGSHN